MEDFSEATSGANAPPRVILVPSPPQPASETAPLHPRSLHARQPQLFLLSTVPAELLVTEAAHVRMLRVLHDVFYQPIADGGFYSQEELQNIFPSLDELIEVHCECGAVALPLSHLPALCSVALLLTPGSLWSSTGEGHTPDAQSSPPRDTSSTGMGQGVGGGGRSPAPRIRHIHLQSNPPPPSTRPALHPISRTLTEHRLSSLLPTALFLDSLMKRRQDSGYLIKEIGDVLLARVREPSPGTAYLPLPSPPMPRPLRCPAPPLHRPAPPRPLLLAGDLEPRPRVSTLPASKPQGSGPLAMSSIPPETPSLACLSL